MATELILIRHGNAVRIHGDYFHAPLTPLGQEQASQTGQYFTAPENHLDGFYCSPLRRTQETARLIGAKIGQNAENCAQRISTSRYAGSSGSPPLKPPVSVVHHGMPDSAMFNPARICPASTSNVE